MHSTTLSTVVHLLMFNSSYQAIGTVIRMLDYLQHNKYTHAYILASSYASDEPFSPSQSSFTFFVLGLFSNYSTPQVMGSESTNSFTRVVANPVCGCACGRTELTRIPIRFKVIRISTCKRGYSTIIIV